MVLSTTLLVALITITFSQIFLYQLKRALIHDFNRQGESLTANLALNAELGLLIEDMEGLEALSQNLLKEDTAQQIRVKNHEGKILVNVKKEGIGENQQKVFVSKIMLSRPEDELSVFMGKQKEGEIFQSLGEVEVIFSQKKLFEIIEKIRRRIYMFALLGLMFGGITAYYLSWIMLNPIKRLVNASKAIASGDWTMRVEKFGNDEIGQLTQDFNQMAASLEKKREELKKSYQQLAHQERMAEIGKFSTIIAHEMKNPLGIIKGAVNISAKKDVPKETKDTMVKYINEEVTRLNQLAEDFLVFARPTPPQRKIIAVIEMVQKLQTLTEFRDDEEKGVKIIIESKAENNFIYGDKNQIFQALLNIIENSVQSSPPGGEVNIAFRGKEKGVTISISDEGPGIKVKNREKIFEPFFTQKEKGTGLGLAIVKKIVEMHDGKITVGENKTGGACFEIWLPQQPATA